MPTCRFPISSGFNIRAGQTMKPDTFARFLTFIFDTFANGFIGDLGRKYKD